MNKAGALVFAQCIINLTLMILLLYINICLIKLLKKAKENSDKAERVLANLQALERKYAPNQIDPTP